MVVGEVVPVAFIVVVIRGGRLRIVVVHHCCGLLWWNVLVVYAAIIHCGRVLLICRHRHGRCFASWSCAVVRGALASWWYVVVCRCGHARPFSALCLSVVLMVVVVCFLLVFCGRNPLSPSFVRGRSGEERAGYSPGLRFCNAKRTLRLSLTSVTPACCRVLPPRSWPYALTGCRPGSLPCGRQFWLPRRCPWQLECL